MYITYKIAESGLYNINLGSGRAGPLGCSPYTGN